MPLEDVVMLQEQNQIDFEEKWKAGTLAGYEKEDDQMEEEIYCDACNVCNHVSKKEKMLTAWSRSKDVCKAIRL